MDSWSLSEFEKLQGTGQEQGALTVTLEGKCK